MRWVLTWAALLTAGLSLGCQPRLPVDAVGVRVAVGTDTPVELCAGTLAAFDDHVGFVEEELGITRPPHEMLDVFVVEDTTAWCDEVEACYIGGWVDATFVPKSAADSVWHELVHQVVAGSDIGMTDRFLSEGLASALGDDWCPPTPEAQWSTTPLPELLGRPDVAFEDYPRAAAFIDFVRDRYGTDALVELVRCVHRGDALPAVQRCFERVFERSVEQVGREFELAATPHHPNAALCRGPVERWSSDTWTREVRLACDDPEVVNTFTAAQSRERSLLLEIPEPGWYALSLRSDGDARVDLEPCFCATAATGVQADHTSGSVWVGQAGTHRVVVTTDDGSASRADLVMTRSERKLSPPV